jgi:hypothetical protein
MARKRDPEERVREKFCVAFIRNPDPVRMRAIAALRAIGEVEVFGIAGSRTVTSKLEVAREFRFMLCFENDLYPGYVTEKVFEAWASGCIPLWWGLDSHRYLNPGALVNLADFATIQEWMEFVRELEHSRLRQMEMLSLPLLKRRFELEPVCFAIQEAVARAQ